jgi:actin
MFERFYVPAFYLGMQDILSLYSLGKTTGLVLDAGHAGARAVSISEGHVIPNVINQVGFGGNQLNKFLTNLLKEIGLNFATNREELTSIDIKEKLCYVSLDYEAEMASKNIFIFRV